MFFALVLLASACCCRVENDQAQPAGQKSAAREAINGFTGKTAVDTLQRARPKIEAAGAVEQRKQSDLESLTAP